MEIVTFAGIFLFLYITHFYFRYFTRPNPLPGPFPLPFIGTAFQIGLDPRKWAEKNLNDSIDIWEFYAGPFRVIVPCNVKYLDKIYLLYNRAKNLSRELKFFKRGFDAYDEVRVLRGVVVQKIFKEFEKQWDENDITTLDFAKWVTCYKAKVTIVTIIGQPLYKLSSFDSISKAASEYIALFAFLIFIPKCISNIVMLFGFNTMKKNSIFLNGTMRNIIQNRRNEIKNLSATRFNLLDLLLISNSSNDSEEYIEGEQPMNDDEIENNLAEITAASIETVSNTLCFLIYYVVKNPSIIEKIHAEILKIFGSDINSTITYETLESCQYIDAIVKETLRHSNPVPYNLRMLDDDERTDKFDWSPGTWFWIDHRRIMNDPNHWKEPNKFNPDRFLNEENGGTDEFSKICKNGYVPFGGGLRICPGRILAVIELKMLIVLFFRKYDIELVNENEPIKYVYRATYRVHDLMIRISQK
ncbi:cytochrome P450 [Gigaspora rosea]|uniref:Cytochrome P450 n=1 Tax=Gigaspora rosea TaxID=44941 RepID=A0A397WCY6_9GLOM|nr:cytochrome P450 [Gigaspora rosea]